ncbi:MAG: hypothetical protein IJ411_02620, partial [Oscillospiraceae bacterium]|nr:hypothetical protein [Oscillospiraceae bacterium]
FGIYPLIYRSVQEPKIMRLLLGAMTTLALAYLAFVSLYAFPADVDAANLDHAIKNAYTMLGCIVGLWLTYEVDSRYIHFDTKALWWAQILKLVPGLLILLGIKAGLKAPLYALLNGSYLADAIRYFLMVAFAGCVWPLTFRFFGKLGQKK